MMIRLALLVTGACAQVPSFLKEKKSLVKTAHPHLVAAYQLKGKLEAADFAEAAKTPMPKREVSTPKHKALAHEAPSRLGGIDYGPTAEDCAAATFTTGCYDAADSGLIDDDVVIAAPSVPASCAVCGFNDHVEDVSGFFDCVSCNDGYSIVVTFSDCTGICADAEAAAYYADFGFGDLDTSECTAYGNCADYTSYSTEGTIAQYIDDDSSYSYSYSYSYHDDHDHHEEDHDDHEEGHDDHEGHDHDDAYYADDEFYGCDVESLYSCAETNCPGVFDDDGADDHDDGYDDGYADAGDDFVWDGTCSGMNEFPQFLMACTEADEVCTPCAEILRTTTECIFEAMFAVYLECDLTCPAYGADYKVVGDMTVSGITYEDAVANPGIFVNAIATEAGVDSDAVTVTITDASTRRRLADEIVVSYEITVLSETQADDLVTDMAAITEAEMTDAISEEASNGSYSSDVITSFASVAVDDLSEPEATDNVADSASKIGLGAALAAAAGLAILA